MYRAPTPPTTNPRNQVTIDLMILAYDAAKIVGNVPHKHALGNAMNALRHTPIYIDTLEKASEVKWLTSEATGRFCVEATQGLRPAWLISLEEEVAR